MKSIIIVILTSLQLVVCFQVRPQIVRSGFRMSANPDFSALEQKLVKRLEGVKSEVVGNTPPPVAKKVAETVKKAEPIVKKVEPVKKAVEKTVTKRVAPIVSKPAPKPVSQTTTLTPPKVDSTALSGGEVATGVAVGLAPYLLIPALLFSAAKSLVKTPKPLPKDPTPPSKVKPYTKPLVTGAKEGVSELLSGKSSPDIELTKKGFKLSAAGFALGAAFISLLAFTSQKPSAKLEESKPPAAKVATFSKGSESVEIIKAPDAPSPKKAPVAPAPEPATTPKKASDPAPVAVKVPEPAAAPVIAPEPVKPPESVTAPLVAPEPESFPLKDTVTGVIEEGFKPKIPKGMEPDVVNLDSLKALRKTKK